MTTKQRLSASVDADLMDAAQEAVAAGRAESVSGWVNEALHRQVAHDRRISALAEYMAEYEAEHGEISEKEMGDAVRAARARAVVVRGTPGGVRKRSAGSGRGRR